MNILDRITGKKVDNRDNTIKTSLALTPETVDLLHYLKIAARRKKKRFVSSSELMENAVRELAKKMNIL